MPVRMRATVSATNDRVGQMRLASDLRRDLWAHAPVEIDPDHPLQGIHRDVNGGAYIEFATASPERVRQVIEQYHYTDQVKLAEAHEAIGEECAKCGNVAGPVRPTVCPNCGFTDITPCPICNERISRKDYTRIAGSLFRCPHCRNRVRLRFNDPMFLANGDFNPPLVVVEEAALAHEIR